MLVLSRKVGEKICIGDDIVVEITAFRTRNGVVRIGIHAPANVLILRGELKDRMDRDNKEKSNG